VFRFPLRFPTQLSYSLQLRQRCGAKTRCCCGGHTIPWWRSFTLSPLVSPRQFLFEPSTSRVADSRNRTPTCVMLLVSAAAGVDLKRLHYESLARLANYEWFVFFQDFWDRSSTSSWCCICSARNISHTSHVTRHTSHVTRRMPHVTRHTLRTTRHTSSTTRHTSHVTRHTSSTTRHTSHVTRHTSHVTRHTSHVTRHTSHVTRHTSHVTRHTLRTTRHKRSQVHRKGKRRFSSSGDL
jgi:hypothetical protein